MAELPTDGIEDSDDLFALDPAQFVAMRNALVRTLKARGDAEAAAEVAVLRKPPRSAWALNLLARAEPASVASVLEAATGVARALQGDGDDLREAQRLYRDAVDDAVDSAARLASVEGETMRARMRATLLAAGAEPEGELASSLRSGTLLDDHDAPGFSISALAGPSGVASPPRARGSSGGAKIGGRRRATSRGSDEPAADEADAEATARAEEEQERVAQERRAGIRRRREAERELDRLRKRADRLTAQAEEAEGKAAVLRADARDAADQVAQLEQQLAEVIRELSG